MTDYDPIDGVNELAAEHAGQRVTTKTHADYARQLLAEAAPAAVMSITHLAQHADNERVQLDACKYIVDKVLGKDSANIDVVGDPLDIMLEELLLQNQ